MRVLLDTSVGIGFLRRNAAMVERMVAFKSRDLVIPAHVVVELEHGIFLALRRKEVWRDVDRLLAKYRVLPFDTASARRAGALTYELARQGVSTVYCQLGTALRARLSASR